MIDIIKDAEQLKNLSFGEKMLGALQTAGIGLGVVFLVLIVLIVAITVMGKIGEAREKKAAAKAAAAAPVVKAEPAPAPAPAPAAEPDRTGDVMAAIFAAISMMEGENSFRIVNVRAVEPSVNWTEAARRDAFASRGSQLK